jgi:hypothetical protein
MKSAKILLAMVFVCAIIAGLLAFKTVRFTTVPVFTPTTIVTTVVGPNVYYTTGNLCTTNGWYITTIPFSSPSTVYYLVTTQPPITTLTMFDFNGPDTITREFYLCTTKSTYVTRAF